jgi:phosphatidylglycerol---prolipoprotein diacylglyceryl transferase
LFQVGDFVITTFGALMVVGIVAGLWLAHREASLRGLPANDLVDVASLAVLAGLVGAKVLFVLEHAGEAPSLALLLDRGGMSWFGGLAGGVVSTVVQLARRRWLRAEVFAAAVPGMALGHMFGRIGCFFVGDDYGRPTALPWGVAFPEGQPPTLVRVHPTQLYEAAFLAVLVAVLMAARRRGMGARRFVAFYLVATNAFRFVLELIRVNVRVAGGLTVAQWSALAFCAAGVLLWVWARANEAASATAGGDAL